MIKILIVDDEKLLRKGFIHMTDWHSHGYHIVGEAGNGEEALILIEALRPDIVVTDIKMPGMDGVALIRAIKPTYPQIEVIVLSSYSDFSYVKESLQLGAADYILKASMSFDEVLCALEKVAMKLNLNDPQVSRGPQKQGTEPNKDRIETFYENLNSMKAETVPLEKDENLFSIGSWNWKEWKEIRPYMEAADLYGLYDLIHGTILVQIRQSQYPDPYDLQKSLVELVYMIIHKLDEAGWNPTELQQNKISHFRKIESAARFEECMNAFKEALSSINDFLPKCGYSIHRYSPTIKSVANHLQQNYADHGLSLGEVAKKFHLNKSYLSQLFKQQVGVNFQNYLTQIRIDKAKELLKQNEPVNEVCLAVGMDNVSYFSQLFKRWVGISPSEYARKYIGFD